MNIEMLYCVVEHGENWESALRRLRDERFAKYCKENGMVLPDGSVFTTPKDDDTLDSLHYVLGGKK